MYHLHHSHTPSFSCTGLVGCWFGVKGDEKLGVFLPNISTCDLAAVDVCTTPGSLSQELLELVFTKNEMAHGCATKPRKEGIQKLDNQRLHAIRGMVDISLIIVTRYIMRNYHNIYLCKIKVTVYINSTTSYS